MVSLRECFIPFLGGVPMNGFDYSVIALIVDAILNPHSILCP